jgi:phosphoribosylglycinamide formyltransferase-1
VLSDRADAAGLARARELGLVAEAVARRDFPDRTAHERALLDRMSAVHAQLVVLAGYMRILSPEFVRTFEGCMFNVHTAAPCIS